MVNFKNLITVLLLVFFTFCNTTPVASLPNNFNNCQISLNQAIEDLKNIKDSNNLNFEIRIVREVTNREECIDMVLGTNLEQGSNLTNDSLVDIVVGVIKDEVTESVKKSEYDFYLEQLQEKNLENKNLLSAQLFGNSSIELILDNLNTVTHIDEFSSLDYDILFSETNGYIYGIKESEKILILDISSKVLSKRESGLHSFELYTNLDSNYLLVTYTGSDGKYYLSAFLLNNNGVFTNEEKVLATFEINDNNVHFGGRIINTSQSLIICLGDQNSPGNSAKFDGPWGKILSLNVEDLFNNPITKYDNEKIDTIAYGLRNPWSCFLNKKDLIVPDVGNSHWEEINVIKDYELISNPIFFGWPWLESYFDSNYNNQPVDQNIKSEQLKNTKDPIYLYPHANDYCAIIGGANLTSTTKWSDYIFIGDFCTGTIWAINLVKDTKLVVLERDMIPYSITTISEGSNESLLVGTTSGQIYRLSLP